MSSVNLWRGGFVAAAYERYDMKNSTITMVKLDNGTNSYNLCEVFNGTHSGLQGDCGGMVNVTGDLQLKKTPDMFAVLFFLVGNIGSRLKKCCIFVSLACKASNANIRYSF
jgi:hypothetical protein